MATKITISFYGNPTPPEPGFGYTIDVSGFQLNYDNGLDFLKIFEIDRQPTLQETIQLLNTYLRENYVNDLIFYSIVGNSIEVIINADANVVVDLQINDDIEITVSEVEPFGVNLIYYLFFDDYVLNIYKENYLGNSTEIYGSFALKKSNVDSILSPIRGGGLDLFLEANQSITFDEFVLNDEFTYKTELLKSNQIIFEGYIKPDGCQQSYVNDQWLVNIESTDGLGALKDLSFVQQNGLRFTGKMSVYNVIKSCLDRTRLSMTINTSTEIAYLDYNSNNILKDIYVRAERFIKDKNDNVLMNCHEVLTSMLNLFSGVITQQDGQWWVYRPNDLIYNGFTEFINQDTNISFTKNLNVVLGSQINNFYPHHCDNNQQIEVQGAISAYRLNYEYGFIEGFIDNSNLNHDEEMVFADWTTNPNLPIYVNDIEFPYDPILVFKIIDNPLSTSGLQMYTKAETPQITEALTSSDFPGLQSEVLTFRFKGSTKNVIHDFRFQIKTSDGYYLNKNNAWVLDSNAYIEVRCGSWSYNEYFITHDLLMPPLINNCNISVVICAPKIYTLGILDTGISNVSYIEILNNGIQTSGITGEFHTVTRFLPPSSITKENQKVFNGDGGGILIGSIFKSDQENLTSLWSRKNKYEALPLLGISVMDDLRIQSNAVQIFSGSVFGQIPYMSVVTIDNIIGLFMPIEYDYDYKSNKSQIKLMQFYNTDLADIQYAISPNFGNNTIKPTIKG